MTETPPLRLWIVDDHAGFRRDLAAVLTRRGFVCERSLSSAKGLFSELSAGILPDAILIDLRMPEVTGLDALKEIRTLFPNQVVILLTASDEETDLVEALRHGASGYLLKTATGDEIEAAILRACRGGVTIDPDMGQHLVDRLPDQRDDDAVELSPKEKLVLTQLAEGRPAKQIAAELGLSVHTVDSHLRSIYRKLEAPNQSAAVAKAFRLGYLK